MSEASNVSDHRNLRHSRWYEVILMSWPFQLLLGLLLVVGASSLARWEWGFWHNLTPTQINSIVAIAVPFIASILTLRRLLRFPGAHSAAYPFPTVTIWYAGAIIVVFSLQVEHARTVFVHAYVYTVIWCYLGYFIGRKYRTLKIGLLPFGNALELESLPDVYWRPLDEPTLGETRVDAVVADLRAEIPPPWQKFLANCTLNSIPVYHVKHISESMTGRVRMDHLMENEIGSLIPSRTYAAFKRALDLVGVALLGIPLLPLLIVTAIAMRLESSGPVIYRQERMGFRGKPFIMYKFRSMCADADKQKHYTDGCDDPRITRVGRIIRKYRIDELPQLLNIVKGDMSFIGPRPEAVSLSEWYEQEIPFFSYRHVVRPGISGWAQVEQGYAAEVEGVTIKLEYDFYYIKYFSFWLDMLIFFKTIKTILTGFGSR
ncbi:exopolysaccharide biosynthesis polyprenyl glycosylphosphotransferase [Desulfurispira natronophila]|uniref:Lipopolysaccharide/colanic/teichoic acid biosynthesis glycosyltransferase n=1 Tax=Desulfurispira natronophila TaxID=682562 RepID=A0A7W7Y6I4_9BACT|nr:exopolysaccharide biosynthesis polyprenyl glycosylphosphotransferase [Desulfurispira natronophila]MBB5022869.1 lipopolysaccharide/colanic/teichoic acid biosynthesis glycosyltransferase [Desulfurispira natronophila]